LKVYRCPTLVSASARHGETSASNRRSRLRPAVAGLRRAKEVTGATVPPVQRHRLRARRGSRPRP